MIVRVDDICMVLCYSGFCLMVLLMMMLEMKISLILVIDDSEN